MTSLIEKLRQLQQAKIQQAAALEERRLRTKQERERELHLKKEEREVRKKQFLEYWEQETQAMLNQSGLPILFAESNQQQKPTLEPVYEVGSLIGFNACFTLHEEETKHNIKIGVRLSGDLVFGSKTLSVQECQKKPEIVEKYVLEIMLNNIPQTMSS